MFVIVACCFLFVWFVFLCIVSVVFMLVLLCMLLFGWHVFLVLACSCCLVCDSEHSLWTGFNHVNPRFIGNICCLLIDRCFIGHSACFNPCLAFSCACISTASASSGCCCGGRCGAGTCSGWCVDFWNMDSEFDLDTDIIMSQMDFRVDKPVVPYKARYPKIVNQEDVEKAQKSGKAKNTLKDTAWSVKVWNDWWASRNDRVSKTSSTSTSTSTGFVPELTGDIDNKSLDFWLSRFVMEVNRQGQSVSGKHPKAFVWGHSAVFKGGGQEKQFECLSWGGFW